MRRIILWLLFAAIVYFLIRHSQILGQTIAILMQAQPQWILIAIGLEVAHYWLYTSLYLGSLRILGFTASLSVPELLPVMLSGLAINIVAPAGGTAPTMLFMDYAASKGESPGKAAAATLIVFLARVSLLVLGVFAALFFLNRLGHYQIAYAIALIWLNVLLLLYSGMMLLGLRWPHLFEEVSQWVRRIINKVAAYFGKNEVISKAWIQTNAAEFTRAARAINAHSSKFVGLMLLTLVMYGLDCLTLITLFTAYHQPIQIPVIILSYVIAMLFWIVSPTPQGIGFVEGALILFYTSFGLSTSLATAIAFAFRGVSFWLPLAAGFFFLHQLKSFKAER